MQDFIQNRMKFEGKCKTKLFVESMQKIDEYINDPDTNVQPTGDQINVKQECDSDASPFKVVNVPRSLTSQIDILKQEKSKIVDELMVVKAENQKMFLDVQHKVRDIGRLKREMESANRDWQAENNRITHENSRLAQENKLLMHEKKSLLAQVKQLKESGIENVDPKNSDVFEVEKLLKHRMIKGKRSFLVRWENYSSKHDSWVNETDLHCENLLKNYLTTNKLI